MTEKQHDRALVVVVAGDGASKMAALYLQSSELGHELVAGNETRKD